MFVAGKHCMLKAPRADIFISVRSKLFGGKAGEAECFPPAEVLKGPIAVSKVTINHNIYT